MVRLSLECGESGRVNCSLAGLLSAVGIAVMRRETPVTGAARDGGSLTPTFHNRLTERTQNQYLETVFL